MPPTQHLQQFRVPKAAELLASTAWNAAEVGARCSFQDASYVAKTFRQLKGHTPSEYRREHASGSPEACRRTADPKQSPEVCKL